MLDRQAKTIPNRYIILVTSSDVPAVRMEDDLMVGGFPAMHNELPEFDGLGWEGLARELLTVSGAFVVS